MSRRGRSSRTRRLGDGGAENEVDREVKSFWHGSNDMPDTAKKVRSSEAWDRRLSPVKNRLLNIISKPFINAVSHWHQL